MNKRLIAALMAAGILVSFTSCDFLTGNKPSETTTAVETTEETTTTAEETTTVEETTTEETSITEETTVISSEETSSETTTATPTPAAASSEKKSKKSSVPSIPKGYKKVKTGWGKKYKGHVVYIVVSKKNDFTFKGWWKNKWIKLDYDVLGDQEGECWYNDKYCSDYYQYMD